MQFSKPFRGVPNGEIYPVDYEPGQECPPELEASAIALEAIDVPAGEQPGAAAPASGRASRTK
jgi:hypothetical protein